ncbi:uncharacterized protein si:ch211-217g15.3 [Scyliorhinus canicula]|uniref:uncharacterized protein si:ch211-217g15.3 n=1 Tax=Scyliorhinus canicula TaxID=7830 RepID=UPI0018F5E08C|nr:uncharacterized protein si:ch211-217g15.3 [Scyliorhinus canicula]
MQRIFILVVGSVLLFQTVIAKPEKFQAENVLAHAEPEEDRDMIYHSIPDNLPHHPQPGVLVLHAEPMNEPEEDRDMIHHGTSNIPQWELQAKRDRLHETSVNEAAEDLDNEHSIPEIPEHQLHAKMVLPYEPMSEPEEDRDMIHHSLPDNLLHKLQPERVVLLEEPLNEPEEDRDMIHHGF